MAILKGHQPRSRTSCVLRWRVYANDFVIIFGSVRTERQGIKVARFIDAQIRSRGHTTALIDPMVYRLPLLDRMYKEYAGACASQRACGFLPEGRWLVIVNGEYNHGIAFLEAIGDRLLFGRRFWRRPRGNAVTDDFE